MSILIFFLKIVFCSGVLFFYYQFFLRNKKFHHYNRFYLLSIAIVSLIFPFINISFIFAGTVEEKPVLVQAIETISVNQWELKSEPLIGGIPVSTWLFNLQNSLLLVYLAGFVFVAILLLRSLQYINHIRKSYAAEKLGDLHIYDTVEPGTPFSFFKSIFWNRQIGISSKEGQQIFRHELFHVRQQHSADSLFMEIVGCIAWFNPFFYIIRKELKAIHAYRNFISRYT